MDKSSKLNYLYHKKCLLVLLYLYYVNDVRYDGVILRSFGFHFAPDCDFKAIVTSKKGHIHKYSIYIYPSVYGLNFESLDIQGNVNFLQVHSIADRYSFPRPKASLNVYFDGENFAILGFAEGQDNDLVLKPKQNEADVSTLLGKLNETVGVNQSAESFLLWLMKFYSSKLKTDLVMGAGINKDYGARDWKELIDAMNKTAYAGNEANSKQLQHYVGKDLSTSTTLMNEQGFATYDSLRHELYEFEEAKSFDSPDSTLYQCVQFLKGHPGTNVITYNYDTNLEYLCKKQGLLYCAIYDDSSFATKEALVSIYHVHGLLPYDHYREERFSNSLIFNESDYYYLYNNPYSWNVAKQLHDFKFHACFFIGISLTDPDMKRLLRLASNPLKLNFIFLKKEEGYSPKVFRDISSYFFSFDLLVVWVNSYDEIGTWLAKI